MICFVRYESSNSGAEWRLSDDDWLNLEVNGWKVFWGENGQRWNGSLANKANFNFEADSLDEAKKKIEDIISKWEKITKQSHREEECECCGYPHIFALFVDGSLSHIVGLDWEL